MRILASLCIVCSGLLLGAGCAGDEGEALDVAETEEELTAEEGPADVTAAAEDEQRLQERRATARQLAGKVQPATAALLRRPRDARERAAQRAIAEHRAQQLQELMALDPSIAAGELMDPQVAADLPAELGETIEHPAERTGILATLHQDFFDGSSTEGLVLETQARDRRTLLRVHVPDTERARARRLINRAVTIQGMELGGDLLVQGVRTAASGDGGSSDGGPIVFDSTVPQNGDQPTLVVRVNFNDATVPCSEESVRQLMFGPEGQHLAGLYRESSRNAVRFHGDLREVTLSGISIQSAVGSCPSFSSWQPAADALLADAGVALESYRRRVYVFPNPPSGSTCPAGDAYLPGNRANIYLCGYSDIYVHELGHNLGFTHAQTANADQTGACEYCDLSDPMGYGAVGLRGFHGPNRYLGTWYEPKERSRIGTPASATYTIQAVNDPNTKRKLVEAPPLNPLWGFERTFISLRRPTGYDANLWAGYSGKVALHKLQGISAPTRLIGQLGLNESLLDARNGRTYTVTALSESSATVRIDYAPPPCLSVEPVPQIGAGRFQTAQGGRDQRFHSQVVVSNTNTPSCGRSVVELSPVSLPPGWTLSFSPSTVSLPTGASRYVEMVVLAPGAPTSALTRVTYSINGRDVRPDRERSDGGASTLASVTFLPDTSLAFRMRVARPSSGWTLDSREINRLYKAEAGYPMRVIADVNPDAGIAQVRFRISDQSDASREPFSAIARGPGFSADVFLKAAPAGAYSVQATAEGADGGTVFAAGTFMYLNDPVP